MQSREKSGGRWTMPLAAMAIGGVMCAAAWAGGDLALGLSSLGIMTVYGAVLLLLGGRFDVMRVLAGRPADERYRHFDLRATAFAGTVTIVVLICGFVLELARGQDGQPYSLLGFVAGVSYVGALLWLHLRG